MIEIEMEHWPKSTAFHSLVKECENHVNINTESCKETGIYSCLYKNPNTLKYQGKCVWWGLELSLKNWIRSN